MKNSQKKTEKISKSDLITLDSKMTVNVNSNIQQLFKKVAENKGSTQSITIRQFMIDYIRENQDKNIFDK